MKDRQYNFRVIIEPDDPNGYHGFVPMLAGVHTCGNTMREVKSNLREAIACHVQGMIKDGEEVPNEENVMESLVSIPSRLFSTSAMSYV